MNRKEFLQLGSTGLMGTVLGVHTKPWKNLDSAEADFAENKGSRRDVVTTKAMVCASQPLAVAAGYDVLKAGGNAVDAAIAINAMLCVVEPMMCGIGGDLFAMVWSEKERKLYGLNASGRSPYNWSLQEARRLGLKSIPSFGPLSWSVPGCVSGWTELLQRFGSRRLSELLEPSIRCAREGFPVTKNIAGDWKAENGVTDFDTLKGLYLKNDKGYAAGEIFQNQALADTFELLSKEGGQTFYEGAIAERLVAFSRKYGGRFSLKDFTDHTANWVEPVSTSYRGYQVWQLPPNGQGMVVLQMLNMLERFDIGRLQPNSAEFFHLFLETKKLAFEDRALYYADMDFAIVPLKALLDKTYAKERAALINPRKAAITVNPGRIKNSSETIYLTVADEQGNMVSLIQSLYSPWGSHYVVDGLGFALQNRGALFSLNEIAWNKLEPHKRPFHTIIPAFVTRDSNPVFSFGVTGGDYQPQGQVQILSNIIDFKMAVQDAGDQHRLWHREASELTGEKIGEPGTITTEPGFSPIVKQKLASMGHRFSDRVRYFGGYQGIWRTASPRVYRGASDGRKDGCAFGY